MADRWDAAVMGDQPWTDHLHFLGRQDWGSMSPSTSSIRLSVWSPSARRAGDDSYDPDHSACTSRSGNQKPPLPFLFRILVAKCSVEIVHLACQGVCRRDRLDDRRHRAWGIQPWAAQLQLGGRCLRRAPTAVISNRPGGSGRMDSLLIDEYNWAKPLFGDTSTWNRYMLHATTNGNLHASIPVIADVSTRPISRAFRPMVSRRAISSTATH